MSDLELDERDGQPELTTVSCKVGDVVEMNAAWAPISRGKVDEANPLGFRIGKLWFGWHELARVVETA
jgi:hypothetical protein